LKKVKQMNITLTTSRLLTLVRRYVALSLLALASGLSTGAHAFGDVRQPNLEYVESNVDLKVKVLGGFVQIKRTWGNGRWYLNPSWADLRFTYDALDNSVKSIERAGSPFEKSGNGIYIFDRQFFIKREADTSNATTGWRWYDRRGNYVTYNTLGKITGYGDRNDVKVSFVYGGDGKLATVNDHFGAVALTSPTPVTYSPRSRIAVDAVCSTLIRARVRRRASPRLRMPRAMRGRMPTTPMGKSQA
jgi:hypothetical protein